MGRKRLKFILLGAGVALSMVFLIVIGMSETGGFVYYMTVEEFLEQSETTTRGFRVNGKVAEGSIERLPTGQDLKFVMTDGKRSLAVSYHGIIPDTFVDKADVVVEGRLQQDGTFVAHHLLAKCPSKYESADGYEGEGYEADHRKATVGDVRSNNSTPLVSETCGKTHSIDPDTVELEAFETVDRPCHLVDDLLKYRALGFAQKIEYRSKVFSPAILTC